MLVGVACTVQGLVHNFAGLAAARWFLGLFEAGLFPGKPGFPASKRHAHPFARLPVLSVVLVQTLGIWDSICHLLQCRGIGWLLRWAVGRGHHSDGWRRGQTGMGMDFHFGRNSNHSLWVCLLLDGPRLPGRGQIPLAGRSSPSLPPAQGGSTGQRRTRGIQVVLCLGKS